MEKQKNKAAVALGKLGAKKNLLKGKAYFSELGKKSAKIRRENRLSTQTLDTTARLAYDVEVED